MRAAAGNGVPALPFLTGAILTVTIQVGTPRRGVQGSTATPGRLGEASLPVPT